jgi:hypothetical protein
MLRVSLAPPTRKGSRMDADGFDTLARSLTAAGTRRRALVTLSGVLGLGLRACSLHEAEGKKKRCPPCKKRKRGKCKGKKPDGTACAGGTCQGGRCVATPSAPCVPQDPATVCTAGCGTRSDNCGRIVVCPCATGQHCLSNGSCATACPQSNVACGTGNCICSLPSKDGPRFCRKTYSTCASIPQQCTTTLECPLGHYCGPVVDCSGSRCLQLCTT